MKESLITFETAKLAKEKGFNELVKTLYISDNDVVKSAKANNSGRTNSNYTEREDYKVYSAPTQSLLQKWLREEHNLSVEVEFDYSYEIDEGKGNYSDAIFTVKISNISNPRKNDVFSPSWQRRDGNQFTYEGALEKGLYEALKLI